MFAIHAPKIKKQRNKFKCAKDIWKKFNEEQREVFNYCFEVFLDELKVLTRKQKLNDSVVAHNLACEAAWGFRSEFKDAKTVKKIVEGN